MITRLFSAALRGVEAQEVEVEVNARGADKPMVIIVGKTRVFHQCAVAISFQLAKFRAGNS